MGKYIVKRVILAIFTIFIISLITFFAMNAIPGGPFNSEKAKSPAVMKELEARYGLDQPLIVQYKNYMAGVLHGDFGVSLKTDRPISDIIGESFPISAKLGLLAALVAIVAGVILGSVAALMRNRWPDRIIVFFVTLIFLHNLILYNNVRLYMFFGFDHTVECSYCQGHRCILCYLQDCHLCNQDTFSLLYLNGCSFLSLLSLNLSFALSFQLCSSELSLLLLLHCLLNRNHLLCYHMNLLCHFFWIFALKNSHLDSSHYHHCWILVLIC